MADDKNPLYRKDLYALGRSDQAKGKINPRLYGNRKYMQGLQDERTRQIDEELKRMPKPKPGSWGFGNAGSGYEQKSGCSLWTIAPPAGLLLALCLGWWS